MKKLISILALACAALSSQAQQNALVHRDFPFLNGYGWLVLSNNLTVTYGQSNYYYIGAQPFNSSFPTNVQAGVTITNTYSGVFTNTYQVPPGIIDGFGFPDHNGNPASAVISVWVNSTNFGWQAPQNIPATNYPALVITPTAASTNVLTFTFVRETDALANQNTGSLAVNGGSGPGPFGTTTQDKFTFAVTCNGLTEVVQTTNVPTSFMQGTRRIRLLSIASNNTTSSPGTIVNAVTLSGFAP